jgi:diguanylate cyclase (GGDEF)-like protein
MRRATQRAVQGVLLAGLVPAGWLAIRALGGAPPLRELATNAGLYLYLAGATALAIGAFGLWLGLREDALVARNRALDEAAVTDPLTGLRNVRYFVARLGEARAAASREGVLAVVVLDLDGFKGVNDAHGHPAGDRLLQAVAHAIASAVRQGETAARVGGEEFALLLPGTGTPGALAAGVRVRRAIASAGIEVAGRRVAVTASIGVAATDQLPGLDGAGLYAAADAALYDAKRQGGNRVVQALPPVRARA